MNNHKWDTRSLTRHNSSVILAMVFAVGLPLALVQAYLFGPSERVSSWLYAQFALGLNTLIALTMLAFCLMLGTFMFVGGHFLRRFLH